MGQQINNVRELQVYREAFALQQDIFRWARTLPSDERYALRIQILRSSRSVGANLAEAWQKRRYARHFVSKLSDADAESAETRHWLDTASACGFLAADSTEAMVAAADSIGRMIGTMIKAPGQWSG